MSMTAAQHRDRAAAHDAEAAASFGRCDTDGFVSQWSSGVMGALERTKAELAEAGGRAEFPALFDTAGRLVAAKWVETRHGMAWGLLESDDPRSRFTGWFSPSRASGPVTREQRDARKGYQVGRVRARAAAKLGGSGTGLSGALSVRPYVYRSDGGFSRDVEVASASHYPV